MKRWVKIILAVLILVLIAGLVYWLAKRRPVAADITTFTTAPAPRFLSQNNKDVSQETTENLKIAKVKAREWKSDAGLIGLNLRIPNDPAATETTQTFVFGSPADPYSWWTISINSSGKFVRALVVKTDFLGTDLKTIQENLWQKTYLEALQIAETNGGLAFRAANPEAQISLSLQQLPSNEWPWWEADYQGAKTNLKIRVNAFDGRVYDDKGQPLQTQTTNKQNGSSTKTEIK